MRITEEMITKLGISMLDIGFTVEDVSTALNAIMSKCALEVITRIGSTRTERCVNCKEDQEFRYVDDEHFKCTNCGHLISVITLRRWTET